MTKSRGQNALVDYGRFAGAIGIVLFHAKLPGGLIGLAALPLFTVFLSYFGTSSSKQVTFGEALRERHARLMVPWYFWCVVYGAAKLADVLAGGKALGSEFHWFMLGTGPSIHLWFLPFAFVLSMALVIFVLPHRSSPAAFGAFAVLAPVVSLACLSIDGDALLPPPWAQWIYVIPPALFGIVLALAGTSTQRLLIAGAQAVATAAAAVLSDWTNGLPQFAISTAMASLMLLNFMPSTPVSSALGRASLGIYLVHPLVISAVSRFAGGGEPGFGQFVFVILLSLAVVVIGQRTPLLRRFF